jgi:type IV secretory pathway VirB4 component
LQTAKNRQAVLIAQQSERLKKGKSRDVDLDREVEEISTLIDDITYDREQTFLVSLYALFRSNNQESLIKDSKFLQQEMEDTGITFTTYSFGQQNALRSMLPLAQNTVKKDHILHTQAVANILPFLTRTFNDENGILLGSSRANNSLVLLDLFKARNALVNVFGVSGSGKSFLVKLIISRLLIRGVQNIIIDPEGEYVDLTNHFNGEVVTFSQDKGINLFQIPANSDLTDHIATLKTFFSLFIPQQRQDLSLLDSLLVSFYGNKSKKNLAGFIAHCKKHNAHFITDLEMLLTGSLKGYFDGDQELSFDNDIICFDLSKLANDDRKIPTMFLVGSLINALIEDRKKQRMIYIDEAHKLLRNKGTIEFYINLVKTARKRKAGVVSITQNPEDFREESGAKTILTQAETSIILKQAYSSMNFIQEKRIFPLTEQESREIISLAIGQALLIREKEHVMLEVFPLESEENYIYT